MQTTAGEIDCAVVERTIEIAAANQDEIHEVPGELQEQPLGRVISPDPKPGVRKKGTVAVPETKLNGSGIVPDATQIPAPCRRRSTRNRGAW